MGIHSFHVFDRRGTTLFTKRYVKSPTTPKKEKTQEEISEEQEQLSEQRKLVFGMLFSLRELSSSLSPSDGPGDVQMVKTGASTLYNYETVSGLRFVLYTTGDTSKSPSSNTSGGSTNTPQSSSHGGTPILTAPTATGFANSTTTTTSSDLSSGDSSNANSNTNPAITADIRKSLKYIYENIWVTFVVRSPMYRPNSIASIQSTSFETELDTYLRRTALLR